MSKDIATTVIYHTTRIHKQEGKNFQEILQAAQELNLTCAIPLTENEIEIVIKTALNNEDYPIFQDCQVDGIITMIYRDDTTMVFRHNAYEFMFTEISVSKGGKLKAMLNLSKDKKYLLKTEISLAIHLHRERFIKAADDKGLDQILVELEGLVRKQLIKEEKALLLKSKQSYIMTDIEKAEAIKDPVCNMEVSDIKKAPSEEYKGKVYYFCAEHCKKSFKKDPASYIKEKP